MVTNQTKHKAKPVRSFVLDKDTQTLVQVLLTSEKTHIRITRGVAKGCDHNQGQRNRKWIAEGVTGYSHRNNPVQKVRNASQERTAEEPPSGLQVV